MCRGLWHDLIDGRWQRKRHDNSLTRFGRMKINIISFKKAYNNYINNQNYLDNIIKFLAKYGLIEVIGNVVFGHTHKFISVTRAINNRQKIKIYNTGTWIEEDKHFHRLEINMTNGIANFIKEEKVYLLRQNKTIKKEK